MITLSTIRASEEDWRLWVMAETKGEMLERFKLKETIKKFIQERTGRGHVQIHVVIRATECPSARLRLFSFSATIA